YARSPRSKSGTDSYPRRYTSSYFTVRQRRSTNTLSAARPRPAMLTRRPPLQPVGPRRGRELHPLVGVEHLRPAAAQALVPHVPAERPVQGVGQPPGYHAPAAPVDRGRQVREPAGQRQVKDVRTPHPVRPPDPH